MTYRCTPHSGTEFTQSYLLLNRQIKNLFYLLRTKTSKIEIKNLKHLDQHCKVVSEYTEGDVLFRNYNSQNKWEKGIVQMKLGSLHYLIKYNNKVVKKHLDQLRPNYIKTNSNHDPSDIVSEIPCDNDSLRKLINHPVSQDTARSPVILRSARTTKGKPPRRFYFDYSDSDYSERLFCIKRLSQLRREGCSNCNELNNIISPLALKQLSVNIFSFADKAVILTSYDHAKET